MLAINARPLLHRLLAELRVWEKNVPARAKRFHELRRARETEIGAALPFWMLWIGDQVVWRFSERVRLLGEIADPLAELIARADVLINEVRQLPDLVSGNDDGDLRAWIDRRCDDWTVRLGRLGVTSDRTTDLFRDQDTYAKVESEKRLTREAIEQLKDAATVLAALGSDVRAAELGGLLPQLRSQLFAEAASAEWLNEIKTLLKPLKEIVGRIQDPPPEVGNLSSTLTQLRRWTALLGETRDELEIQNLEAQVNSRVANWDPADGRELEAGVDALRVRILEKAAQRRSAMLRELEDDMADLRQACGDQPDLEQRFGALKARPFDRPQFYREWLDQCGRFQQAFRAVAQSQIGDIETRLRETVQEIEKRQKVLEGRPLSEEVNRALMLARQDLDAMPQAARVEDILHQLRRVNEIAQEIAHLDARARRELEEVDGRRGELSARNATLQSEVLRLKRVNIEIPDMAARIAALAEGAPEGSLAERILQAAALAAELETLERHFVDRCRQHLDAQVGDIRRAVDVLRLAHRDSRRSVSLPVIAADARPEQAADAILEASRVYHGLREQVRRARQDLDARRIRALEEITELRPDDLAPGDWQTAEVLRRELDAGAWLKTKSLMDRVERMAATIEKCELFFERLRHEQRSAREHLRELQQRYRTFNEEQLYHFCPELADRVAALILGIPEHPRHWGAIHHQLDGAAALFGRVELQARRLAADELDLAVEALRERIRQARDASFRDASAKLLADLEACDPEKLAPVTLRLRILNAAQQRV